MRCLRQTILAVIFLLVVSSIVLAKEGISVETNPIQDIITINEYGQYYLYVMNNKFKTNQISIKYLTDDWRVKAEPELFELKPAEQQIIKLSLYPLESAKPGVHAISFIIWSETDAKIELEYPVKITYVAQNQLIATKFDSGIIDPMKKENVLSIKFRNNHNRNLKNLDIEIISPAFFYNFPLTIKANEEKTVNVLVKAKPVEDGSYPVDISFYKEGILIAKNEVSVTVTPFSDFKEETAIEKAFLIRKKTITASNNGNTPVKKQILAKLTVFQRLFTDIEPQASLSREGNIYIISWEPTLKPNEVYKIVLTTSYRTLASAIVAIIILIILYYVYLSKDLVLKKKILTIKGDKGTISNIKILLVVKNRSSSMLKEIKVLDKLPMLLAPIEDYGALKPSRIKRGEKGIAMIWEIPNLAPSEEVVISYTVRAKLDIVGQLLLPRASASYLSEKGQTAGVQSNKLTLLPF